MNEQSPARPTRLAIIASHPIQHFVPFYRAIAKQRSIELKVFFCSRISLKTYYDPQMGVSLKWAADLTSGYDHEFLPEADRIVSISFSSVDNPSIAAALTAFAPDAVVVGGYAQKTALRALFWSRRHGVPILMSGDGHLGPVNRSRARTVARELVMPLLLRLYAGFLTVGDENERMYAHFGVSVARMFRSPFTIDETVFLHTRNERASRRARLRSELGITQSDVVFLFIGKLAAHKRPMDFVEATLRLTAGLPDSKLVSILCGDGEKRAALTARIGQAGDRVRLAGFVNLDQLPDYYAAADVLIQPSDVDNHPLTCSEAACVGLPMIVSDHIGAIGPTDIARPDQNAIVYPCGDIGALAGAMRRLASNPELRVSMSAASVRIYDECGMAASLAGLQAALDAVVPTRRSGAAAIR
jgi:glycosyltransferase involved in cell wall biosynthesis